LNKKSRFLDARGVRVVMSDGTRRGPAHAHPWATIKILVDGPPNRWRTAAGDVVVEPGDALLMNAFEMHEGLDRGPTPARKALFVLVSPETVAQLAPAGMPAPSPERPFVPGKAEAPVACRLAAAALAAMLGEGRPLEPSAPELAHTLASALIANFAVPAATCKMPVLDFRLRHAIERAHTAPEHLTVDDMVATSGLSRSRFFELFTGGMGLPPQAFLDALLLFRALDELPLSRKPVAEIGRQLGFAVPDTFTRFVAREVGLTPRALRKVAAA
jgi:AraC-like DNA-binding protein